VDLFLVDEFLVDDVFSFALVFFFVFSGWIFSTVLLSPTAYHALVLSYPMNLSSRFVL